MGKYLRTLRSKVIAITVLVVIGTQIATVLAVLIAAKRDTDTRAQSNLRDGAVVFEKLVANRGELLQKIVQPLAAEPAFVNAVVSQNSAELVTELAARARWIGADIAVVVDTSGTIIAASGQAIPGGYQLTGLTGTGHSSVRIDGAYYEVISQPVWAGPNANREAGRVAMGFAIDDTVAQSFASVTGLEMTLLVEEQNSSFVMLGSSLSRDNRAVLEAAAARVATGTDPLAAAASMRDKYFSIRVPYLTGGRQIFAILQVPAEEAMAPFAALKNTIFHAASTALLASMLLAFGLSRSITKPVNRLLLAARRMRVGNYSRQLEITSKDEFGELAGAFESMRESIADREKHIVYQAQFDALTGLPNRNQAMEILRSSLRISAKTHNPVAIMIMHLQRFREIQSSLGHEIGDEVLRQVALRMSSVLEESHVLSRLEGDQFMLIAPNTDRDQAKELALQVAVSLDTGLNVQSVNVTLDACIGICLAPEHGRQPDELIRRAAVAKNDAQQSQKRVRIYQNGREARHVRQLAILGDLRRAVRENELKLFLQPQIELRDTRVSGAEALLRWDHPELGQIPPYEFIPLAESAGSIAIVTDWVIERVTQQIAAWQKIDIELPVAINLSRLDLLNKNLPALIQEKLTRHGVAPHSLILEITEEAVVQDIDRAAAVLEELRAMGMSISMDDFGTGYSSLGHLQKLPVDELKIDRAFVTCLPEQRENAAIVRSIIELAHNLAMEVVAEGVETTAALRWLREEGCERAQGYYLGKPMPAGEFQHWYADWQKLASDQEEQYDPGESLILRPRLIS